MHLQAQVKGQMPDRYSKLSECMWKCGRISTKLLYVQDVGSYPLICIIISQVSGVKKLTRNWDHIWI